MQQPRRNGILFPFLIPLVALAGLDRRLRLLPSVLAESLPNVIAFVEFACGITSDKSLVRHACFLLRSFGVRIGCSPIAIHVPR
jgi:hypothetical protein